MTTKRIAVLACIAAGVLTPAVGYVCATVLANLAAVDTIQRRLDEATAGTDATLRASMSAPATMPTGGAWTTTVAEALPAVVGLEVWRAPRTIEANRLWLVPGVRRNLATDVLSGLRAWAAGYGADQDQTMPRGYGAGFLASADGLAITAAHVIDRAGRVRAIMADGSTRDAHVVAADLPADAALIRVEGAGPYAVLPLAEGVQVQAGEPVVTIGSPAGQHHTITAGIVAAPTRHAAGPVSGPMIQLDAVTYGGSSGGAVIDGQGRAIGLVSWGIDRTAITFAVPITRALEALRQDQ